MIELCKDLESVFDFSGRKVMEHNRTRKKIYQGLQQFLLSGIIFFVITMPVRFCFSLMPVAEIRSAAVFPPFFGMIYGFWGALGCAVANLIMDLYSGNSLGMSICSFPVQCLLGMLPYWLWYAIPVRGEEKPSFPIMDTTAHVLKYMLIILVKNCCLMSH